MKKKYIDRSYFVNEKGKSIGFSKMPWYKVIIEKIRLKFFRRKVTAIKNDIFLKINIKGLIAIDNILYCSLMQTNDGIKKKGVCNFNCGIGF